MHFKVKKSVLASMYAVVSTAIPGKAMKPILKMVHTKVENGVLQLRATDSVKEARYWHPVEVIEPGELCLEPMLFRVLNYFGDVVEVKLEDDFVKLIDPEGKRGRHEFNWGPAEKYTDPLPVRDSEPIDLRELKYAFNKCGIAVSSTALRLSMQGVWFNPHLGVAIGADGVQLVRISGLNLGGNICLPDARLMGSPLSLMDTDDPNWKYSVTMGSWMVFSGNNIQTDGSWTIQFTDIREEFLPNANTMVDGALEGKPQLTMTVDKEALLALLDLVGVYADRAKLESFDHQVDMLVKNGAVRFSIKVPGFADMVEKLDESAYTLVETYNPDVMNEFELYDNDYAISFWPDVLKEGLAVCGNEIEIRFFKPSVPFLVLDKADDRFAYLQMPLR